MIVQKDGPYEVRGEVPLSRQVIVTAEKGGSVGWKEGEHIPAPGGASLCRRGHSSR